MRNAGRLLLLTAFNTGLYAQTEAALKAFFEGKTVLVSLDLPATKDGVDVYPKNEPKVNFKSYSDRIRRYGVSLRTGDSVTITTVRVKDKNIRRDPRVALSLLGDETNAQGLREYVVIYGNARVTEGAAVPLLQRLAPIYLGPKADFPPASMRNIPGYVTRITPARLSGIGPWVQQAAG